MPLRLTVRPSVDPPATTPSPSPWKVGVGSPLSSVSFNHESGPVPIQVRLPLRAQKADVAPARLYPRRQRPIVQQLPPIGPTCGRLLAGSDGCPRSFGRETTVDHES